MGVPLISSPFWIPDSYSTTQKPIESDPFLILHGALFNLGTPTMTESQN